MSVLVMLLLLSYHRRLKMTSETLELRVEGRRISHSWCMCVISGGLDGGGGMIAPQEGWSHVGRCRNTSPVRCRDPDDARSHRILGAQLMAG